MRLLRRRPATRRLAVIVCVACLGVASVVSATAARSAPATVDAGTFVLSIDTFLPCGVGGETIELTGTARYHFAFVTDAGGGSHLTFGAHEDLTGTGLTTGLSYGRPGTFMDSIQLTAGAAQVVTHITDARLTGPNGEPVSVVRSLQVTVDGTTVRSADEQFFCAS